MATGPQILPGSVSTAPVRPPCPVSQAFAQAVVQLVLPCPTPHWGWLQTQQIRARGKDRGRGLYPTQPACSPGEESRWAEKQSVSPSCPQMLGTIRINGLGIQVRAIQKLRDYSKCRSLRRKRLIEAQNWKRSNPGSGGRAPGERLLRRGGPGLPPKEEMGLDSQLRAAPPPTPSTELSWVFKLLLFIYILTLHILCPVEPYISQESLSGTAFERCFPCRIHRAHARWHRESPL